MCSTPASPLNRWLLPVLLCLLAAGCSDGTRPDVDGSWTAELVAPAQHANGALLVELTGAGIREVTTSHGRIWSEATPGGVTVLLIAPNPGALRFRLRLDGAGSLPEARIIQVADGEDRLREPLTGYSLRFVR